MTNITGDLTVSAIMEHKLAKKLKKDAANGTVDGLSIEGSGKDTHKSDGGADEEEGLTG